MLSVGRFIYFVIQRLYSAFMTSLSILDSWAKDSFIKNKIILFDGSINKIKSIICWASTASIALKGAAIAQDETCKN